MAIPHIGMGSTPYANRVRNVAKGLKDGVDELNDIFKTMEFMKNSGTFDSYVVDKFGFADLIAANAAFDELNSLQAKLNANTSVVDLNAAILQAARKFA